MKILIAEDDDTTRLRIEKTLTAADYKTESYNNGLDALTALRANPDQFHAIILDRAMPRMEGLEVLKHIKSDAALQTLPVIMETAKDSREEILEGLKAGAYYYLTKPFLQETLLAIVKTAVNDYSRYSAVKHEAREIAAFVTYIENGRFGIRTVDETRILSSLLAQNCPNPAMVAVGLSELLLNAVEYGSLGMSYNEKSKLIAADSYRKELDRRATLPENAGKKVRLEYEKKIGEIRFLIRDEGRGFDWRSYLEISSERACDSHGRGIAMSRMMSFDRLEYLGKGNEVLATVTL